MSLGIRKSLVTKNLLLVSALAIGAPASAWAYGGGGVGCSDLPEYYRAVGALQGLSVCDMTVEQARRIIAAHDGTPVADPQAPRRHRHRTEN